MTVDFVQQEDWFSLLLFIAPLFCFQAFRKLVDSNKEKNHEFYLQQAHQLRLSLDKPRQSRFRVVALLVVNYDDGTAARTVVIIPGTNDEPSPAISGALCAERAAFLQLRLILLEKKKQQQQLQQQEQACFVEKVYIVTDATSPIPPGMLCREYMYGHDAVRPDRTLFILQSQDSTSQPLMLTLCDLYPYPSLYMRLSVEEVTLKGRQLSSMAKLLHNDATEVVANNIAHYAPDIRQVLVKNNNVVPRLLQAAQQALKLDNRDILHPLRYGAAAAILRKNNNNVDDEDDAATVEIVHAGQRKAAEYGASLDAVCQLASLFQADNSNNNNNTVLLIVVQMDQYGILHPPFAVARTFLVEHGHGDAVCLFMKDSSSSAENNNLQFRHHASPTDNKQQEPSQSPLLLDLVAVPARELAPFPPEFR